MKRILLTVLVASAITSASAALRQYDVVFAPEAQGASGTGTGTAIWDDVAHTLALQASFSGLSLAGSGTTVSHIHLPTAIPLTGTAGVVLTPTTLAGFPVGVRGGEYNITLNLASTATYPAAFVNNNGGTAAGAEAAAIAAFDAGRAYWNIHTGAFGGGEIRGFLTAVPEPSTMVFAGLGLGALAVRFWQRRQQV
jgi:hypothetical protein